MVWALLTVSGLLWWLLLRLLFCDLGGCLCWCVLWMFGFADWCGLSC